MYAAVALRWKNHFYFVHVCVKICNREEKIASREERYENYYCRQRQSGICHRQFAGAGGSRYHHGGRQHQRPAESGKHHGRAVRGGQRRQHQCADRGRRPRRRSGDRRHQSGRDQSGLLPDRQKAGSGPYHRPCPQHRLPPGRGDAEKGDRSGYGHQSRPCGGAWSPLPGAAST